MLKFINPKYCEESNIKLTLASPEAHLLITGNDLIFLKNKSEILFDQNVLKCNNKFFTHCFAYDKSYLNFEVSDGVCRFENIYFTRIDDQIVCLDESLLTKQQEKNLIEKELNRDEIENILNPDNYDSIYLIDRESRILYAKNKDKVYICKQIVPDDTKLLKLWQGEHNKKYKLMKKVLGNYINNIENVKNISIYDKGLFHGFNTLLITTKDGKTDINWLGLDFLFKDRFKLTLCSVPITKNPKEKIMKDAENFGVHATIKDDRLDTNIIYRSENTYIKTK